jgi:hypothetical protein
MKFSTEKYNNNKFSIICVKGHLNQNNKNKNPYLSSNKI